MKVVFVQSAGHGLRFCAVMAALVLAGCASRSVPMQPTQSASPGAAASQVSAGANGKGGAAAKPAAGASAASGVQASAGDGVSSNNASGPAAGGTTSSGTQASAGSAAAGGGSDASEGSRAGAAAAGSGGDAGGSARAAQAGATAEGVPATATAANASTSGQEDADRLGAASRATEDPLAAERARQAELDAAARARQAELDAAARARQAELDAAERARQAELDAAARARQADLDAAERERRGRVETAANQVLIGENEKLQTLDGLLPAVLNMDDKGQFDFDSYTLSDSVKAQLNDIAARLAVAPYDQLHVVGFTDRIGSEEYNRKLSEKRAWSVAGYLMDKGVPPYKLKVEGKGEAGSLIAQEECKGLKRDALIECLQRDRRVELVATVKEYNLKVQ